MKSKWKFQSRVGWRCTSESTDGQVTVRCGAVVIEPEQRLDANVEPVVTDMQQRDSDVRLGGLRCRAGSLMNTLRVERGDDPVSSPVNQHLG